MAIPQTKILLGSTILAGGGITFATQEPGDLTPVPTGVPAPSWISGIADLNGDGLADFVVGVPGDDDKALEAGRVFVSLGSLTPGSTHILGADAAQSIMIEGWAAGDLAGASVGSIADLNGDGLAEILVGAPSMDKGAAADAGIGFVLWGQAVAGGIDLGDPNIADGSGYAIKGEAAGDRAATTIMSLGDMNGDGLADVLVGAAGNDAGGVDAGAAYVVWGKATDSIVQLTSVAAGTGGFKIIGEGGGDAVGSVLAVLGDQNGDGRAEILIGVPDDNDGGTNAGAVYVVDGKATGAAVDLGDVAAGIGGYKITGVAQDDAGAAVSSAGDVNGDGLADILIGAPRSDSAYVVFGKADHLGVDLAAVAAGAGGFKITAEAAGDLDTLSVTGGADLNRDGIADFVIGASANGEGGNDAGAVYVVWGGRSGPVDLGLVAQGIGGAKIVGAAGSLTGANVAITGDANGDGVADLIIGAPGVGEKAHVLFSPLSWQPDDRIYGTAGNDVMAAGYGNYRVIGEGADLILGLNGNDSINGAGGADSIEGGAGLDTLLGDAGNDTLDGGTGADSLSGGAGDDTYYVDNIGDITGELAAEGADTVFASVSHTLGDNIETLVLTSAGRTGTGNAGDNVLIGSGGADTLNGGLGADVMGGGLGDDSYYVDNAFDTVNETNLGGVDTLFTAIDNALSANIENLVLIGAARIGVGNSTANRLTGTAFDDQLNGGLGADTMTGGAGDDLYYVDNVGDSVVEVAGGGNDAVVSSVNHTLGLNFETLTLTGTALNGTGNSAANRITGNASANRLNGGAGADTLEGGAGDDTFVVDNAGDVVIEAAGGGNDTVEITFDYTLTEGEIENLTLTGAAHVGTGNSTANRITGGVGADTLDGAGGVDTLAGGAGDDTYLTDGSDIITELAGGGTDTMIASVSVTLAAEVERLVLSGAAAGTGNALANTMTGSAGAQTLIGLEGNDTLDGGAGADTMEGGLGDDTYYVDDLGDVVIEGVAGGIDTVVTSLDGYVMAAGIENVRLTGTAHVVSGNDDANTLSGAEGDDDLDGGGGDDLLLGGDGDDDLRAHAGHDTLSGGSGDDRYHVSGSSVEIEDYLGHDEIECEDSIDDNHIDLSGDTDTVIDDQTCHITPGGTTSAPLDVQFLQDRSGSFGDDIAMVRTLIPQIAGALTAVQANSQFGVSSFIDKPVSPFGATGEWVYAQHLAQTKDTALLAATYNGMSTLSGADAPEAQIEGLMQLALHIAEAGFRPDAARFVVLFTDAPFHVAGDGAAAGITTPNNGDNLFPGGGAMEDYPTIAQLQAALVQANIIPIFAIAGGVEASYQSLATQLGRGTVVTLTANSSNIVTAITAGITAATTTRIEDARGGSGHDDILGGVEDNGLWGNGGDDLLDGRSGDDTLCGGAGDDDLAGGEGDDTAHFTGARADYAVTRTATGFALTDLRGAAGEGTDTVQGVEKFQFADGLILGADLAPPAVLGSVADTDLGADAVAENAAVGTVVGLDVQGLDTDGLGIAASFALVTDATGTAPDLTGAFQIDAATGVVTVRDGSLLNFEAATSQTLYVQATAGAVSVVQSFVIAVTDVFEPVIITPLLTKLADIYTALTDDHYVLVGKQGNDVLTTLGGNDTVTGGVGNDTLSTGAGDDLIRVTGTRDGFDAVDGGIGADRIEAGAAGTVIGLSSVAGVEVISGAGFADVVIRGSNVANVLDFAAITLDGISAIEAGAGNDTVTGSAGADRIVGGAGADLLTGAAGADVFDFNLFTESRGGNTDTITDFAKGIDLIDLAGIDADTLLAGDQAFSFLGAAAFGGHAGELRVDGLVAGYARMLADVNGDAKADFQVMVALAAPQVLEIADFIL